MTLKPIRFFMAVLFLLFPLFLKGTDSKAADYTIKAQERIKPATAKSSKSNVKNIANLRYLPSYPSQISLCNKPVPLFLDFVNEQMDREFTIAVHDQAQVVMWMKRASRYFPYITRRLKEKSMPDDLKYLAVAESALIYKARSHAGAVGLWQFIAGTGRRYGLRRNRYFDDRLDLEKSTTAALAYLKDLYEEFGSWPLAMAAYNCGEARVRREIKEQGIKDYFHLYLPNETMRYVYRILSAKIILSNPEKYGYHLPLNRLYKPIKTSKVVLRVRSHLHLRNIAIAAKTTLRRIKTLNPAIRNYHLPSGTHVIKVPYGSSKGFKMRLAKLGSGPIPKKKHWVVKQGDTLSLIARKNNVKIKDLRRVNRLKSSTLFPGQRLFIPGK